jgi:hypothetical protein
MTIRFIDGFDYYATSQVTTKWSNQNVSLINIAMVPGRFGGSGLQVNSDVNWISRVLDNQPTWVMGFAFKTASYATPGPIAFLHEGGSTQTQLYLNGDGTLSVYRNVTQLGKSIYAVPQNAWVYLEWKSTINSVNGYYEVRVGGTPILYGSGNNSNTGNAFANEVGIGYNPQGSNNSFVHAYDDLYCLDGTTGPQAGDNTFLGERRVDVIIPTGAGTYSQFTKGGSTINASNWQQVAEMPPDNDVTYNFSSTAGQIDSFMHTPATGSPPIINAVQFNITARIDDATTRNVSPFIRLAGTDYPQSGISVPNSSYLNLFNIAELDPSGSPWNVNTINSMEIGYKLNS